MTPEMFGRVYLVSEPRSRTVSPRAALTMTSGVVSAVMSTRTLPVTVDHVVPG